MLEFCFPQSRLNHLKKCGLVQGVSVGQILSAVKTQVKGHQATLDAGLLPYRHAEFFLAILLKRWGTLGEGRTVSLIILGRGASSWFS